MYGGKKHTKKNLTNVSKIFVVGLGLGVYGWGVYEWTGVTV